MATKGHGGIYKTAQGRWTAYAWVHVNGQRKQLCRTFSLEREAKAWKADLAVKTARGEVVQPAKATVEKLFADWFAAGCPSKKSRTSLKDSTLAGYKDKVHLYILPMLGNIAIGKLQQGDVDALYRKLEKAHSSRTVIATSTVLNACLGWAVRSRKLAHNPAEGCRLPRMEGVLHLDADGQYVVWTAQQARQFLTRCAGDDFYAAFHLALHTGMRRGEICGLRWQDVDFASGKLSVRHNRVLAGGKPVDTTPKGHDSRSFELDPGTLEVLKAHRQRQMAKLYEANPDYTLPADIFTTDSFGRLNPDTLSYRWENAVKAAGVPCLAMHGARHTYATLALQAGEPVQSVSKILGHRTVDVTWNVYQSVIGEMKAQTNAKVAALLS